VSNGQYKRCGERDGDSGSVRERKQSAKDVDCQDARQLPIKKEPGDRCIEGS